jgi:hypothetical protein
MVAVLVVSEFAATRRSDPGDDGLVRSFQASHESTVELEPQDGTPNGNLLNNLEALRSQKTKLEHAVERLIDSFAEGLIEKDQFAGRMARTKSWAS